MRGFAWMEHVATPCRGGCDPPNPPLPYPLLACAGITSSINQAFDASDLSLCSTPSAGVMNKPVVATSEKHSLTQESLLFLILFPFVFPVKTNVFAFAMSVQIAQI